MWSRIALQTSSETTPSTWSISPTSLSSLTSSALCTSLSLTTAMRHPISLINNQLKVCHSDWPFLFSQLAAITTNKYPRKTLLSRNLPLLSLFHLNHCGWISDYDICISLVALPVVRQFLFSEYSKCLQIVSKKLMTSQSHMALVSHTPLTKLHTHTQMLNVMPLQI